MTKQAHERYRDEVRIAKLVLAGVVAAVVVVGACAALAPTALARAVAPDSLAISRLRLVGPPPREIPDGLDASTSDAGLIDGIRASIDAMPRVDESRYFCPASIGIRYRLDLRKLGVPVLRATAEADGCRFVRLGPFDVRASSGTPFWDLVARALGVPPNEVFPDARRFFEP